MTRKNLLKSAPFLVLFAFFSLQAALTSGQGSKPVLTISPLAAITDDRIKITCAVQPFRYGALYFKLSRNDKIVAERDVACVSEPVERRRRCDLPELDSNCDMGPLSCHQFSIANLLAKRETMAGEYKCTVQSIRQDMSQQVDVSDPVFLTVGDKTPPVKTFTVIDLDTNKEIMDNAEVSAGVNTTVTCETEPARPEPAFLVTITGRENRTNLTVGHRISFHESVPRNSSVVYQCEVFNGFGERLSKRITLNVKYGGIASDTVVPKEIPIQMESDIEICSIRNHPSARLTISKLDKEMVQPNYPIYKEEPEKSFAYVRLSSKAAEVKDAKLTFECSVGSMPPVVASISLISTNTAMMTGGIVAAAIVAFLLIVGGIAYALKRRSASPKPQSDKARYDRVNQNDAARRTRNKLDDMPSTDV